MVTWSFSGTGQNEECQSSAKRWIIAEGVKIDTIDDTNVMRSIIWVTSCVLYSVHSHTFDILGVLIGVEIPWHGMCW